MYDSNPNNQHEQQRRRCRHEHLEAHQYGAGCEDGEEDGEELGNDESFEAVLPEHHLGVVNYAEGTRVKECVTFENRVYPISNVRMFVQECSVPGWVVTFVGEEYTNATIICSTEATFHEVFYYCVDKVAEVTDVTYEKVFD